MRIILTLLLAAGLPVRLWAGSAAGGPAQLIPKGDEVSVLLSSSQPAVLELKLGLVAVVSSPAKGSKSVQTHLSVFKAAGSTYTLADSAGFKFENTLLVNYFRFGIDNTGDIGIGVSQQLGASAGVASINVFKYGEKSGQLTLMQHLENTEGCAFTSFEDRKGDAPPRLNCDFRNGDKKRTSYQWDGKVFAEAKESGQYSPVTVIKGTWGNKDAEFGLFKQPNGGLYPDMKPNALFVDSSENIYILDPVNKRIVVYTGEGAVKKTVSLAALKDYAINNPWINSLAVDPAGIIYIRTQYSGFHFPNAAVVKIDGSGKVLGQYGTTSKLREFFQKNIPRRDKELQKVKSLAGITELPDSIGRLLRLLVDDAGRVQVMADGGVLVDLSEAGISTRTFQGWPSSDRKVVYSREPPAPGMEALPRKPDAIERLRVKAKNGGDGFTIEAKTVAGLLPAGAKVQEIWYLADDASADRYFLVVAENTGNNFQIMKYKGSARVPGVIFPVYDTLEYPLAVSHAGNIYQLVTDADKNPGGVSVVKWCKVK